MWLQSQKLLFKDSLTQIEQRQEPIQLLDEIIYEKNKMVKQEERNRRLEVNRLNQLNQLQAVMNDKHIYSTLKKKFEPVELDITMEAGEGLVLRVEDILHLSYGCFPGIVYVTNFRILFKAYKSPSVKWKNSINFCFPLMMISRMHCFDNIIEFHCKDLTTWSISFIHSHYYVAEFYSMISPFIMSDVNMFSLYWKKAKGHQHSQTLMPIKHTEEKRTGRQTIKRSFTGSIKATFGKNKQKDQSAPSVPPKTYPKKKPSKPKRPKKKPPKSPDAKTNDQKEDEKEDPEVDGWKFYSEFDEYSRMNVVEKHGFSDPFKLICLNKGFKLCSTYPPIVAIPASVTDSDIRKIALFRTKNRFPSLCWKHPVRNLAIYRCSQPKVGMRNARNQTDEQFFKEIGRLSEVYERRTRFTLMKSKVRNLKGSGAKKSLEKNFHTQLKMIQPVVIADCRPKVNAYANQVGRGGGFEDMSNYIGCQLKFLEIGNIHVMREGFSNLRSLFSTLADISTIRVTVSLSKEEAKRINESNKQKEKFTDMEVKEDGLGSHASYFDRYAEIMKILKEKKEIKWFGYVEAVLRGTEYCINKLREGRVVVVHCSDGWDRTPQITSLMQICVDPYYRTIKGLISLICKEWLRYGHKFAQRVGHGIKREDFLDTQRSPIFLQFMDALYQIKFQNPKKFEYNDFLLITIIDNIYGCKYGTFLYNSHSERVSKGIMRKTHSLWTDILKNLEVFQNPEYVPPKEKEDKKGEHDYNFEKNILKFDASEVTLFIPFLSRYDVSNHENPHAYFYRDPLTNRLMFNTNLQSQKESIRRHLSQVGLS